MAARRRGRATTWAVATALVGTLSAAPRASAAPLPQLARDVRVDVSGMRSVDVYLPKPVKVPFREWFDAPSSRFENFVAGSGMALVSLEKAHYGPTLIAQRVHHGNRGHNVVMPFGEGADGKEIGVTEILPRGRYRLYAWSPKPTRMILHLTGLSARLSSFRPTRPVNGYMDRVDAPLPVMPTGVALGSTHTMRSNQYMVLLATAERLNPSVTGYYHGQCLYPGTPPGGVFLHACPGGAGQATGLGIPMLDQDQVNAGAFVAIPGGTASVSTWLLATGKVHDQTATFVWLPLPLPLPEAGSSERRAPFVTRTSRSYDSV